MVSQGKVVALYRWGGKWNHLSMTHRLTTNYAKNYCNRTHIIKVIVENVVTCFLGTRCTWRAVHQTLYVRRHICTWVNIIQLYSVCVCMCLCWYVCESVWVYHWVSFCVLLHTVHTVSMHPAYKQNTVWSREHCTISPSRFLAEYRKRLPNWGSFLLYFALLFVFSLCIFLHCFVCQYQSNDWFWRLPP